MKIAVVHGGTSSEQAISTLNAGYVKEALIRRGYQAYDVPFTRDIVARLIETPPDAVFLCVQGKGHGDGTLQGMLDHLQIPYTGSRMAAAAVINDKILCQKLFALEGIGIPEYFVWPKAEHLAADGKKRFLALQDKTGISFPCVAKAPTQGGSFGLALLDSLRDYEAMEMVFTYDDPILVERFVQGIFITVGLLEKAGQILAFPPVEVRSDSPGRLITLSNEYQAVPIALPDELTRTFQNLALRAFRAVGASGYGRVDFMLEEGSGIPYTLEINAVPGLKPQSLFPPAAKLAGIEYDDMIETILQNALAGGRDARCSAM
ncbi:MAG: hypothetical protein M0009_00835 [Deltaproteobacteria bacterium]|nr:hypothetical protein [Deltaproteobacteria bacterium]